MAIIKELNTANAGEDVEKPEPLCTGGNKVKWLSALGNTSPCSHTGP